MYLSLGPSIPYSELIRIGVEILDKERETVRILDPDLDVTTVIAHEDRSAGVVQAAEDAQLIVVGRESRRGATDS